MRGNCDASRRYDMLLNLYALAAPSCTLSRLLDAARNCLGRREKLKKVTNQNSWASFFFLYSAICYRPEMTWLTDGRRWQAIQRLAWSAEEMSLFSASPKNTRREEEEEEENSLVHQQLHTDITQSYSQSQDKQSHTRHGPGLLSDANNERHKRVPNGHGHRQHEF